MASPPRSCEPRRPKPRPRRKARCRRRAKRRPRVPRAARNRASRNRRTPSLAGPGGGEPERWTAGTRLPGSPRPGSPDGWAVIVIGLGNPGDAYAGTRHNVGFRVVEAARERWRGERWRRRSSYRQTHVRLAGRVHRLIEPQTYMNASGEAVAELLREGAAAEDLLVVLDDIDLPFGRLRIRERGGDGGHRGLASVLQACGTPRVGRLRVGVGRPPGSDDVVDHVLEVFTAEELRELPAVVRRAREALETVLRSGLTAAMNRYNAMPAPGEAQRRRGDRQPGEEDAEGSSAANGSERGKTR
ncbi:MAG: aminoacyl-tRNA hydrolase [Candidatus Eisenbacteria bacterium]|nr:aminoacyl-tRNA hydrolase [Candidatus Eisenbacteria bacterium]